MTTPALTEAGSLAKVCSCKEERNIHNRQYNDFCVITESHPSRFTRDCRLAVVLFIKLFRTSVHVFAPHVPQKSNENTHLVGGLGGHVQSSVTGVEGGTGGEGSGRADEEGGDSKLHGLGVGIDQNARNCEVQSTKQGRFRIKQMRGNVKSKDFSSRKDVSGATSLKQAGVLHGVFSTETSTCSEARAIVWVKLDANNVMPSCQFFIHEDK